MPTRFDRSRIAIGAVVLGGGKSERMGQPKALLPFGAPGQTMLTRIVDTVAEVCQPVVVVSAANQPLPDLPADVQIHYDPLPDEGPLLALATGLRVLPPQVDTVFLCSCDVPLLKPEFIQGLQAALTEGADYVVPVAEERRHPLTAIYRASILPVVDQLLADGERSLQSLLSSLSGVEVSGERLKQLDPEGRSLFNVNRPEDYEAARRRHRSDDHSSD